MKRVATTIQISEAEDKEIMRLKDVLRLPNKRAVVLEGVRSLWKNVEERRRIERLQSASRRVRKESLRENKIWAPFSTAVHIK